MAGLRSLPNSHNPRHSLRVQLHDFTPTGCFDELAEEELRPMVVEIPYQKLCSFLRVAETR
jgi:hypothetical protein